MKKDTFPKSPIWKFRLLCQDWKYEIKALTRAQALILFKEKYLKEGEKISQTSAPAFFWVVKEGKSEEGWIFEPADEKKYIP